VQRNFFPLWLGHNTPVNHIRTNGYPFFCIIS